MLFLPVMSVTRPNVRDLQIFDPAESLDVQAWKVQFTHVHFVPLQDVRLKPI